MARTRKRTNKLDMEQVLVGYTDVALAAGTLTTTTPALNIVDGQLGVLSEDTDSTTAPSSTFLTAGQTVADADKISLRQGTPLSATTNLVNAFQAGHQGTVIAGTIQAGKIRSVTTTLCSLGTYSSMFYDSFATPLDLTPYSVRVDLDSVRNDRDYGDNDEVPFSFYTTLEYTDAAVAAIITNPLSHLLSNLVYNLDIQSKLAVSNNGGNRFGNRNMVVFGINTAGGAGQALGTIVNGTSISVLTGGDNTLDYVADLEFVNTVNTWIANGVPAAATIEPINLTLAGTAGGAATAIDSFLVMGLDETKSIAFDNVKFVRTRVIPTLGDGFLTFPVPTVVEASFGVEETGRGSDWTVENDNRARLNIHNMQNHPHGEFYVEGTSYVDPTKSYTSTIIDYYETDETLTTDAQVPAQAIILLECAVSNPAATATVGLTTATVPTATVASLNAILSPWLTSEKVLSNHAIKGAATAGTYFV